MSNWTSNRVTTELPPSGEAAAAGANPPANPPRGQASANPSKLTRWLAVGFGVALVLIVAWALVSGRSNRGGAGASAASVDATGPEVVRTASARRGEFLRTVRLHGTTEAIQSRPIAAPRLQGQNINTLVITHLTPSGTQVKKGDLLVEFDRQTQIKAALDKQAEYRDFLQQINKKKADQSAALAKDQSELKQAENAFAGARMEVQRNEILSKIDAEKNNLNLEETKAKFNQLRETFDLKRKAALADLRVLEIQRDRALNAMRHAEANAEKLSIHSPMDGMIVFNTIWKGGSQGEVMEGDEIRAGVPFMQVINPLQMQVRARVNQADVASLRSGQDVQVHLDAYPDLVFPGKVERLAAIGTGGSFSNKVRTFVVTFSAVGNDVKLMPDLSAGVDVELDRRENALIVPRDAVFIEGDQTYVRIPRGDNFEKRAVKIGPMSDIEAVVESGLDAGVTVQRAAGSNAPSNGGSPRSIS